MTTTITALRASALALAAAALLAGCGGGGSDAGCSAFSTSCTTEGSTSGGSTGSGSTTAAAASITVAMSADTISASTPGTVTAVAKNADGTPAAGALVTFAVANGAATLTLERVKTDANGRATTTLQPVAGKIGADIVAASFTPASSTTALSAQAVFSVSATNVSLNAVTAAPASISSYGASVITVDVSGASSSAPVTVNFSSTCVTAGKAELSPASVTVTGTTASTTYQDKKGCAATDRISASISATSQQKQVDLVVAAPIAQSLEFVSASPDKICLAGSGCEISSKVSFKLKDQYNNPITNRTVRFSLDIPNVAMLGSTSLPTDASGVVTVSVTAKATPTPVRVRAQVTLDDGSTLSTVSNALAINAGLPTQNAFSFSASTYNPDGWSRDGTESDIRVQLNDRFGNPVPDGTVVSFVTEGASVIPAKCTTASGVCMTKFVTSNFRPLDGRITVLAYAQGEESFADADGDQKYTVGENFTDLGPVFIDANENGVMDGAPLPPSEQSDALGRFIGNEYIAGSPLNQIWDGNTYVRMSRVFILADASLPPRLQEAENCSSRWDPEAKSDVALPSDGLKNEPVSDRLNLIFSPLPTPTSCRVQKSICVRDANKYADKKRASKSDPQTVYWLGGNPIPSGTTLSVATKAKGASVKIDNTPIVSQLDNNPTRHLLTVELDDCTKALEAGGAIDLTIKMPNGQSYTYDLGSIN
ncbi:MAG: Ig-like domain-containing protein [Sphaerotilus natans]